MKNTIAIIISLGFSTVTWAQAALDCTPQCKVECGSDQVPVCKVKNGGCITRCLSVPSDLKGNERKAFILSAILEQEVTLEQVKESEFKGIWRAHRAEVDGAVIEFAP